MPDYVVIAEVTDPYSEEEHDRLVEFFDDIGADLERVGDGLRVTYPCGGNVDASQHVASLMRDFEDFGLEAGALTIHARPREESV